jgi:hypothetical protein
MSMEVTCLSISMCLSLAWTGCPSSSAAGVDGLPADVCFLPSGNKFIDLLWVAWEVVPSVSICYTVAWI